MALSVIQASDSGASTKAHGTSFNMGSTVTAGSLVLTRVWVVGTSTITSLTGLGATWSQANTFTSGGYNLVWMIGTGATGSQAITVNLSGTDDYTAMAYEVGGAASAASAGTPSTGASGTSVAETFTGLSTGQGLFTGAFNGGHGFSGGPSSPWVIYTAGPTWWNLGSGAVTAYEITTGTSDQTATFTQTTAAWGISGVIVTPSAPATVPMLDHQQMVPVLRAATR